MALVVFVQEDDVPSVYRNLKIFCETAPGAYCRTIHLQDKSRTRLLVLDELFITIIHFLIMAVCFTSFHDIGYCLNHANKPLLTP